MSSAARLLPALLAGALCCPAPAARAAGLTFYTEVHAPHTMIAPGQTAMSGFSFDLVTEAARRAHLAATIVTTVPWARAQAMVADPRQQEACLFALTQTPQRLPHFQWIGPLNRARWTLFARDDFKATLRTLDDARPYRIGGYNMDARTLYVVGLGGFKVDAAPDDRVNPAKLAAGRIDLWISNREEGVRTAESVGVHGLKPVLTFREVNSYLACGQGVTAKTVQALQAALDSLKADGTRRKLARRYQTDE